MGNKERRAFQPTPEPGPRDSQLPMACLDLSVWGQNSPVRKRGIFPSGSTEYYIYPPYHTVTYPHIDDQHNERMNRNRETVKQLIAPDVQLTNSDVQELVAAYYLGYQYSPYYRYKTGLPYPNPEEKCFAPIKVTYEDIGAERRTASSILLIPLVNDLKDAFETTRYNGLWASFRAASSQKNLVKVDVLLSGKLLPQDEAPRWHEVWLIPPEKLPG
ncbi:MAG TPA: hypothetical protein VE090_00535 [Methylomirabilota bacterium]|nr:hypothetical protein [Methylomirabilota bacterium]